ncbi:Smr/MutS family protein [Qipengyuania nanhaisediminis]|uniref:Smr/MutS family protein n=1 Tax=Qipengyuania nanhaisediminis TaxID=604088 RepID=UPI0038B37D3E
MSVPRGLSAEEQAAWAKLAQSVTPIAGRKRPRMAEPEAEPPKPPKLQPRPAAKRPTASRAASPALAPATAAPPPRRVGSSQLDGHWNRKLKSGQVAPDYTLDLHGHTLDGAYERVMSGLDQARAMEARVVLVIAGRERPVDPADRGHRRGAIRAKLLDWLAASRHADAIAAIRRAHVRHGGEGALYLILSRSG